MAISFGTVEFQSLFAVPLRNGLTRPKSVRGSGIKMVNMGEIFAHNRIGDVPMDRVPLSDKERTDYLLAEGDLLFARQSLVAEGAGKCSIMLQASEPLTFESHIIRARLDPHVANPAYYYYFFSSSFGRATIGSIVEQVAAAGIRGSDLAKLEVPRPPLTEQHGVARILGRLDDKIELNRRMNATLETMAKALFKSWFIDFEPVHAKVEGSEPVGMNAETAALFPDMFEDSELGSIPQGWTIMRMPGLFDINPPRLIAKGAPAPYLEMGNMPTASARVLGWEDRDIGSGMRFINGDTLVARITPCLENGKTAFVDFLEEGQTGWGSTEYIVFRSKPPLPVEYAYFLARSDDFRSHAIQNMTGTSGRQRVPVSAFDNYLVVKPSADVARLFGTFAGEVLATMKAHDSESTTLAAIRDTLLPKLVSGEIRVHEADKTVEAALA